MVNRVQQQKLSAFCSDTQLRRLTRELATPLYLYDEKSLLTNAQALFASFSWNSGFREYVPLRRCRNPALLRILHQAGCGAMCSDFAQLQLAAQCGFSGERLLYAPAVHHLQAEALAWRLDATWVIDGEYILPPKPPKRVLLRYNPGGKLRAAGKVLANFERVKFGMRDDELLLMLRRFAAQDTESIGVMLSACENSLDPAYYPAVAQMLFKLCVRVHEQLGIRLHVCNLSGGFGVSGRTEYASPEIETAAEKIRTLYDEILTPAGLGDVQLQTTLDRYLLANAAVLISEVLAVRERELPTCFIDAVFEQSMLTGNRHPVSSLTTRKKTELALYCVVGCQDSLRGGLGEGCVLPQTQAGDRLVIHTAGHDAIPNGTPVYLLRPDGTLDEI